MAIIDNKLVALKKEKELQRIYTHSIQKQSLVRMNNSSDPIETVVLCMSRR